MARPLTTVEGRVKPVGDKKSGKSGYGGLVFTRVRGVRRLKQFASAPREQVSLPSEQDFFEERYQRWYAIYGGTRPEYIVYDYLERVKKMVPFADFVYQSSRLGGRERLGGAVVDFEIPSYRLYFRVQGERFHLSPDAIAHDILQKALLTRYGWRVIDIWSDMLTQSVSRVMEAALRGEELRAPRMG